MRISVGDKIPDSNFYAKGSLGTGIITSFDLCDGQNVALFGLEGGFESPNQAEQLPAIVQLSRLFRQNGIDTVACVAVNEPDRMLHWARELGADNQVLMLADWNAEFAEICGFASDMRPYGLGLQSHRYGMVLSDGVVSILSVNDASELNVGPAARPAQLSATQSFQHAA